MYVDTVTQWANPFRTCLVSPRPDEYYKDATEFHINHIYQVPGTSKYVVTKRVSSSICCVRGNIFSLLPLSGVVSVVLCSSRLVLRSTFFGVMSSNGEKGVGAQKRVVAVVAAEPSAVRTRAQSRAARNVQCPTALARSAAARAKLVRSGSRGGSPRGGFPGREDFTVSGQPLVGRRVSSPGNPRASAVAAAARRVPVELPPPSAIPSPTPL